MTKFKLLLATTAVVGAAWTLSAVNDRQVKEQQHALELTQR